MAKKIGAGIAIMLLALVIVIALQPSKLHIERNTVVLAPPAEVFAQVNNPRKTTEWSPWTKLDPAMTKTFDGPAEGEGASYSWNGNDQVGEGKMTVVESRPNEIVKYKLEFVRPMADVSYATYTLQPNGDGTTLTWTMDGDQSFMEKAVCLFMDIDAMLGAQFDEGFTNLKKLLEKPA